MIDVGQLLQDALVTLRCPGTEVMRRTGQRRFRPNVSIEAFILAFWNALWG